MRRGGRLHGKGPRRVHSMSAITATLVEQSFSSLTFHKGEAYYRGGAARVTRAAPSGALVEGEVQGSRRTPYRTWAQVVRQSNGRMQIRSHCSCPLGGDCKHVVALLLQAAAEGDAVPKAHGATPARPVLSAGVADWLAQMERASRGATEDYPPDIRRRLIYVLSLVTGWDGVARARLAPMSVPLLKDGSYSASAQSYTPSNVFNAKPAQFLRPSDFTILRRLASLDHTGILGGESGAEILDLVLKTGRCHWESLKGPPLGRGDPRPGAIRWSAAADGRHRPAVEVEGDGVAVSLAPPWYVDAAAGVCGPVEVGLAPRLAGLLLEAPPIEVAELPAVRTRLATTLPEAEAHLPPQLDPPRRLSVAPVPRLRLHHRRLSAAGYPYGQGAAVDVPLARLSFLYDGREIGPDVAAERQTFVEGREVVEVVRSRNAERQAAQQLERLGFEMLSVRYPWGTPTDCRHDLVLGEGFDETAWVAFLSEDVPDLAAEGWRVDVADDFPIRLATPEGEVEADLSEGSGIDWFDLHLGVPVDGVRIDILPLLLRLLRQIPADQLDDILDDEDDDDRMLHLRLEDGRILSLPFARMRPILKALTGLFAADGDSVRVTRADAVDLAVFAEALPRSPSL